MKFVSDLVVTANIPLHRAYVLLKLTSQDASELPPMFPGQFVEVRVDDSPTTFLRRPISVHYVDVANNELWLLVQCVGDGTRRLSQLAVGDVVNMVYPLGNTFTLPDSPNEKLLLVGGGVGVAPLLFLGERLRQKGFKPAFLLGARTAADLLQLDAFEAIGEVYLTTEDGSAGEQGYVTQHSLLEAKYDRLYTCGPRPMMEAVARYAQQRGSVCEVSLENTMACGIGVCLCCVENTQRGNVCVCKEGPVFNIDQLKW